MNYAVDRRRPIANIHLASDRLSLPWAALQDAHSRAAVLIPWIAMAAVLLFASLPNLSDPVIGGAPGSNILANTPALILSFPLDLLLPDGWGEVVALCAVPLLQLLFALFLVRGTLRCLEFRGAAANIGLAIMPLLPLAIAAFTPLSTGLLGWQALGALAMLRLLVDRRLALRSAVCAGMIGGVLIALALENLVLVAAGAVLLGVGFIREGHGQSLTAYLTGTALGASALAIIATDQGQSTIAHGHIASWPHILALWAMATTAAGLCLTKRPLTPVLRVGTVIGILAVGAIIPAAVLGRAALQPFAGLDPMLMTYWQVQSSAGDGQWHHAIGMVLATLLIWSIAIVLRARELSQSGNPRGWLAVVILSGSMVILALFEYRAALFAQLLAIPLFALLLRDGLRVASRFANAPLRVAAICCVLLAVTPSGGSITSGLAVSLAEGRSLDWPAPLSHAVAGIAAINPTD